MKILLIGLGGWGKNHLRVWNELNQDLYVTELDNKKFELCKTFNMRSDRMTSDYHDFLDEVDAVDIVTPTDSHYEISKECLKSGKDVFVEKPITMHSNEAMELIELAKSNGQILQVGHIFRFNPASRYIKEQIDKGRLGKIRYLFGHYMAFKRARTDVGVTQTDSIHYFDLFNYFLDKTPIEVTAVMKDHFERGLEDTSICLLNYGDELAQIESGYLPPGNWRDITIIGEKATIVSDIVKQDVAIYDNHHEYIDGIWTAIENGITHPKIVTKEPLTIELRAFMEAVEKREPSESDGKSGYNTLKIVEASYESSRLGKKIRIEY